VSLFIRAPDFGFLKPLHRATQFLRFSRARITHDTNSNDYLLKLNFSACLKSKICLH